MAHSMTQLFEGDRALPAASDTSGRNGVKTSPTLSHLRSLEAESIYILREAVAEFSHPAMLYSIGKDSSVMLRLAQKAFSPGKLPFPLLHIDTSYKFPEMIHFRDSYAREIGADLIVHRNEKALVNGANPFSLGTQKCCGLLKTKSLLDALAAGGFNAAFGGARRDEEKSRAKERIYSFRDVHGQWDPKNQRPELWNLFNSRIDKNESIRVFPLSNWTELDVWLYIHVENIPIVPLYFARERQAVMRNGSLILIHSERRVAARRKAATREVSYALSRLRALHRSHPVRGRHLAENYRGDDLLPPVGARKSRHRSRRRRLHGIEKTRRLFLMVSAPVIPDGFEQFLQRDLEKELLRFTTAGSVDDGKSTLIGRLLHDAKAVYEDQLASVKNSRINRSAGPIDFSLLTDGLRAEREQGITIDVAYRHFATARRKFIIADTPGHEQYTRNMATGASTANLAVVLVDAAKGLLPQTRRHSYIASLLGIPNVLAAVNKMDLVGYREDVFAQLRRDFLALAGQLRIPNVQCVPVSALERGQRRRSQPQHAVVLRTHLA